MEDVFITLRKAELSRLEGKFTDEEKLLLDKASTLVALCPYIISLSLSSLNETLRNKVMALLPNPGRKVL